MRIVFLGDVYGRSGREGVLNFLPDLRAQYRPDAIIVNVENAAAGSGVTLKLAREFLDAGVACLTLGNHVWGQKELIMQIDQEPRLMRPLNMPDGTPGRGFHLHVLPDGRRLLVTNLLGRLFMDPFTEDPFAALEKVVAVHRLGQTVQAVFVDMHAEATSEKLSLARVFDGRVSAVIGTHTHVPTADTRLLPRGTAYQSDAGMCGDHQSVIGVKTELAVWRFTHRYPGERPVPADGPATICGTFIETDDKTGQAKAIEAIRMGVPL